MQEQHYLRSSGKNFDTAPMKTMGDRIKDLRIGLKMSQQDVADALTRMGFPISQRGISKLENDQVTQPKSATIRGLAKLHQVEPDWLVTGKGQQNAMASLNSDESELILLFRSLSKAGRDYVLGRCRDIYRDEHAKPDDDPDRSTPPRPKHPH